MFEGNFVYMAALARIDLPGKTLRLCDGGVVNWPAEGLFVSRDPDYGGIGAAEVSSEALVDESPSGSFTMLCPSSTSMINLAQSENQMSPIKFWIAQVDATGLVIGTPEVQFSGYLDTLEAELGANSFEVNINYVSEAEKLFAVKEGNVLTDAFHQRLYPGELGLAHTTGVGKVVPWGVAAPRSGGSPGSSLAWAVAGLLGG